MSLPSFLPFLGHSFKSHGPRTEGLTGGAGVMSFKVEVNFACDRRVVIG